MRTQENTAAGMGAGGGAGDQDAVSGYPDTTSWPCRQDVAAGILRHRYGLCAGYARAAAPLMLGVGHD